MHPFSPPGRGAGEDAVDAAGAVVVVGLVPVLVQHPDLVVGQAQVARGGRRVVERTYAWPVVVEKYLDLLAEVRARNA